MKICAAQARPFKGDIAKNIEQHIKFIAIAAKKAADLIIFPELSITGYEPELANRLATTIDDSRFDVLQQLSNSHQIVIAAGMPVKAINGIMIGMIIFQPQQQRLLYGKQYLHEDEYPFFVPGKEQVFLQTHELKIALSVCYELSVPEHAANASKLSAAIYLSSVAKTKDGVDKAAQRLSQIALDYSMQVVMVNSVGPSDNFLGDGRSAAWNNKGQLIAQLGNENESLLIFDTKTREIYQCEIS